MSTSTRTFLTSLFNSISSSGFNETFLDTLSYDVVWTATGTSLLSGKRASTNLSQKPSNHSATDLRRRQSPKLNV